jgi:Flp pilus assembly protein CpaB
VAPTVTPDVAPIFREKSFSAPKPSGGSPLFGILAAAILILLLIGIWRAFSKPTEKAETIQVVAAAADLPPGCRLAFPSLHYLSIPKRYLTPDMVTSFEQVRGRIIRTYIPQGEPISASMLMPAGQTLSLGFENDQRAMTLQLDEDALVDHSIYPGDRVDILCISNSKGEKFTKTIAQSVPVLMAVPKEAILSQRSRGNEQNRITLAVLPDQSEEIAEAVEVGKIRLVLRNRLSRVTASLSGVAPKDLLPAKALISEEPSAVAAMPLPPPPMVAPPPPAEIKAEQPPAKNPLQWVVEVFTGSQRSTYGFPQQGQ